MGLCLPIHNRLCALRMWQVQDYSNPLPCFLGDDLGDDLGLRLGMMFGKVARIQYAFNSVRMNFPVMSFPVKRCEGHGRL